MIDPFTNGDEIDRIDLSQVQHQAEYEQDNHTTLNNLENEMTEPTTTAATPAKKKIVKKAAPAAAPAKKTVAKKAAPAPKAAAKPKAKAADAPRGRQVPDGFIGLDTLATELKLDPTAMRRKLRNSEIAKPDSGVWAWKDGSRDLAAVRKLFTAA